MLHNISRYIAKMSKITSVLQLDLTVYIRKLDYKIIINSFEELYHETSIKRDYMLKYNMLMVNLILNKN